MNFFDDKERISSTESESGELITDLNASLRKLKKQFINFVQVTNLLILLIIPNFLQVSFP